MKALLVLTFLFVATLSFAQDLPKDNKVVRKIYIKHIDPQLLALLLAGNKNFLLNSELSVLGMSRGR